MSSEVRPVQSSEKGLMVTLLGTGCNETGSLLSEYKKWFREGEAYRPFSDQVSGGAW